jgi:ribosomal protein S18 acetylase RimI-like enzyme
LVRCAGGLEEFANTGDDVVIIRRAVVQDAEGLVRVHVDTWKTAYRGIIAGEVLDRMSYTGRGERWRQTILEPEGKYIYVAEWNQQDNSSISSPAVVGFAIAGSNRDDDTHVFKGEVHGIYVLDKYQGKGVGRRLFTRAVQSLLQDGMDSVKVWVLADNVNARGFYERLGGELTDRRDIKVGGIQYPEVAYGWRDATVFRAR